DPGSPLRPRGRPGSSIVPLDAGLGRPADPDVREPQLCRDGDRRRIRRPFHPGLVPRGPPGPRADRPEPNSGPSLGDGPAQRVSARQSTGDDPGRSHGRWRRTRGTATAGYGIYPVPGSYVATANRTISSRDYAFVANATVPVSSNLNCALSNATRATGHVLFQSVAVPGPMSITFLRQGGGALVVSTDVGGSYSAILATGNYSVSLSGTSGVTENGAPRFYRYTFSRTVTVSTGASVLPFDLNTVRTLDNTTLTGVTTQSGQGVDAQITFTARGGGAITAQAASDSNGLYSVTLAPGTYDVYARRSFGSVAFFARISVAHAATLDRDVPLSAAFLLSGVVSDPLGAPTSAS